MNIKELTPKEKERMLERLFVMVSGLDEEHLEEVVALVVKQNEKIQGDPMYLQNDLDPNIRYFTANTSTHLMKRSYETIDAYTCTKCGMKASMFRYGRPIEFYTKEYRECEVDIKSSLLAPTGKVKLLRDLPWNLKKGDKVGIIPCPTEHWDKYAHFVWAMSKTPNPEPVRLLEGEYHIED